MRAIGIDLAWGRRNTTAAVCLESVPETPLAWSVRAHRNALTSDAEIAEFVRGNCGDAGCIVAIDAPTHVPNQTGQRPCEAQCRALYGRYEAGPHPANRSLYGGDIRGETLVAALAGDGFLHDPSPPARGERRVMEVFPHPAHVALFGLPKTLKYKAKPGRSLQARLAEFERYASLLRSLSGYDPSLRIEDEILDGPQPPAPAALKRYEDALDALTCAYLAAYYLRWGAKRLQTLGDRGTGHIVVPRLAFDLERVVPEQQERARVTANSMGGG